MRVAEPVVLAVLAAGIFVGVLASVVPQSRRWLVRTEQDHVVLANVGVGALFGAGIAAGQIAALGWGVLALAVSCGILLGGFWAGLRILVSRRRQV